MKKLFFVFLLVMSVAMPAFSQSIIDEASYTVADLYNQYKWFWDSLIWAVPAIIVVLFSTWSFLVFVFTPKFLERQNRETFSEDKKIYHGSMII